MDANSLLATFLLAQAPPGGADMLGMLVPLIMVMGVFYLLIWRPQAKAAQKHLELVNALKVGDEVVTDAGVFGKVSSVDGDIVTLEISKGVKMRIRRKNIEGYQGQAGSEEAAS